MSVYFNGTDDTDHVYEEGRISFATLLDHITVKDSDKYLKIVINIQFA
jgi:hypothetical protein